MKQQDTFKLDKGQTRGMLSTLLLSLVLILPVVVTACASALPEEAGPPEVVAPVVEEAPVMREVEPVSDSTNLAENPELMIAGRYEGGVENDLVSGSAFYAANPELLAADRYSAAPVMAEATFNSTFFAENPELMAAHRYAAATKEK